jgi:SAM-dependent methyltransferase
VTPSEAAALIRAAVRPEGGRWADVGAGGGVFTRALAALLGPTGRVYALDRDPRAVRALGALAPDGRSAPVTALAGDLGGPLPLPKELDGAVLANVLHFVAHAEQPAALARVAAHLRPGGRLVVVEYEGRRPNRWVPFPVSLARFAEIAADAGLGAPELAGERASAYGGTMYAAVAAVEDRRLTED